MSGVNGTALREPGGRKGAGEGLVDRGRLLLLLGVFVLELLLFFGAMVVPIDPATRQRLQQAANSLQNSTADRAPAVVLGLIFSNNVKVALAEMIPGAGALVFFISILNTGQVIQVLALSRGVPGVFYGVALFLFPFSIVELSAYALAVSSGLMLIVAWRRNRLRREAPVFVFEMIGVVLILLVAATMETITLLFPEMGLALWLPTGLLVAWLAITLRRAIR
jgi:uncharacterized membrane protein SpoIIM required for sporulation